jgi:hypothetical protein
MRRAVLFGVRGPIRRAQERLLCLAEARHVRAILATAQQGGMRDHQNLMQVRPGVTLPWIGHPGKAGD